MEAPDSILEVSAPPPGTSAHKAKLITMTQALKLAKGKIVNIYTDSPYTLSTAHVYGLICKEKGLLKVEGMTIKI